MLRIHFEVYLDTKGYFSSEHFGILIFASHLWYSTVLFNEHFAPGSVANGYPISWRVPKHHHSEKLKLPRLFHLFPVVKIAFLVKKLCLGNQKCFDWFTCSLRYPLVAT